MFFVEPAYAQTAGGGGASMVSSLVMMGLIFGIFYFLMIRPQQKKMKEHKAMIEALRRGDQVITQGGLIGKIAKIRDDAEVEVEIAADVRVRVLRSTIVQVMSKTEPSA